MGFLAPDNGWLWLSVGLATVAAALRNPAITESIYPWPLWITMCIFTVPFALARLKCSTGRPIAEPKIWCESVMANILIAIPFAVSIWHLWYWGTTHRDVLATLDGQLIFIAVFPLTITAIGGLSRCIILANQFLSGKKAEQ